MSIDEVMFHIPTIEQNAHLGNCSDRSRDNFVKYVYRLPLSRGAMNQMVLSGRSESLATTPHTKRIIRSYLRWLKDEWANECEDNRELYRRAMEYVRD